MKNPPKMLPSYPESTAPGNALDAAPAPAYLPRMLEITLANERQNRRFTHSGGPLEFGRSSSSAGRRCVVMDRHVSRDQLRVEELPGGWLRVTNLGKPIVLPDGATLETQGACEKLLPLRLVIGYTTLDIAPAPAEDEDEAEIAHSLQTLSPRSRGLDRSAAKSLIAETAPSTEKLAAWFETLLSVQQAAAGSAEFYEETAKAVVDLIGLDRGLVLVRRKEEWTVQAQCGEEAPGPLPYSRTVLRNVLDSRQTFFQSPRKFGAINTLAQIEAVVAAPVFDAAEEIIGVVYGSRDLRPAGSRGDGSHGDARTGVTPLEAQLVQLLAGAVSNGLARLAKEAEAARNRVELERFVSPQVARELERNPQLLEGADREVTVVFTDLRGFTKIAQKLGAKDTYRLAGEILDGLTQAVMEHEGTIIDYYGDGFAAMWNAPVDQPDHAALACRTALTMNAALPELNARWSERIGTPIRIGVGINTGMAQVGNAGSQWRRKYGPRGHTVNLASRIEGATKFFEVSTLISQSTRERLDDEFHLRRIGRVQVVGVEENVELWEVFGPHPDPNWSARCRSYESAVRHWEEGRWAEAQAEIETLLKGGTSDTSIRRLKKTLETTPGEPVFKLDRK
jgi:adenylate cyclase